LSRAADVVLKERRRLVLGLRETPLHSGHLRTMVTLSDIGAIIAPIVPGAAMIWNVVRSYRASDEFVRLQILEAAAVTALFTAFWTLAYAFLELLGLPHISVGFVHTFGWPVFIWKMVRLMRMRA